MDERDWRQCRQCLSGDADACACLLKAHEPLIARQMWRFTRNRATQAELVQEVLVEVYLSLPRYRPAKTPLEHWVSRIATRVGYRFWKRESRQRRHVSLDGIDLAAPAADRDTSAAAILHELLSRLRAADRLVLTLMYFEECSIVQIGQRTGWNKAVVKMRAMRARSRLRELIVKNKLTDSLLERTDGPA